MKRLKKLAGTANIKQMQQELGDADQKVKDILTALADAAEQAEILAAETNDKKVQEFANSIATYAQKSHDGISQYQQYISDIYTKSKGL